MGSFNNLIFLICKSGVKQDIHTCVFLLLVDGEAVRRQEKRGIPAEMQVLTWFISLLQCQCQGQRCPSADFWCLYLHSYHQAM